MIILLILLLLIIVYLIYINFDLIKSFFYNNKESIKFICIIITGTSFFIYFFKNFNFSNFSVFANEFAKTEKLENHQKFRFNYSDFVLSDEILDNLNYDELIIKLKNLNLTEEDVLNIAKDNNFFDYISSPKREQEQFLVQILFKGKNLKRLVNLIKIADVEQQNYLNLIENCVNEKDQIKFVDEGNSITENMVMDYKEENYNNLKEQNQQVAYEQLDYRLEYLTYLKNYIKKNYKSLIQYLRNSKSKLKQEIEFFDEVLKLQQDFINNIEDEKKIKKKKC